jgi:hypothetical protein
VTLTEYNICPNCGASPLLFGTSGRLYGSDEAVCLECKMPVHALERMLTEQRVKTVPKGKNFSKANRGQRNKSDFYQTPYSMTEQLLDHIGHWRSTSVLEPAAGDGAITKVLRKRGFEVIESDIRMTGEDFLTRTEQVDWIITNPPFTLSLEFILQCKRIARKGFWLLMPIEYLHGQDRYEKVFSALDGYPLHEVLIFTRRAMLTDTVREDGRFPTGMITWAWYGWRNFPSASGRSRPAIGWIDNNKYVLRKRGVSDE